MSARRSQLRLAAALLVLALLTWGRIVLIDHLPGTRLEFLIVLFRPPVLHVAFLVVLRSLVVERVSDLVSDHHPDSAIVQSIVGVQVEIGRLQNSRRENDFIQRRIVISRYRRRRGEPLGPVDRLANLCK